jgi:hypothetical protein
MRGPAIAPHQAGTIAPYRANDIKPYPGKVIAPSAVRPGAPSGNAGLSGTNLRVIRHSHSIYIGGVRRTFIPIAALGAVYLGGRALYPYGYVSMARPYCSGVSEYGCALTWQPVPLEGGGAEAQCVEFCPQGISPAAAAAFATLPAIRGGRCEVVVHSDRRFTGLSAPTHENQPRLADVGWKNEISSIEVKAGIWDFFTDDEYSGEMLRLTPGAYEALDEKWTKRIGSMMCVNPDGLAARHAPLPVAKTPGCEIVIFSETNFGGVTAPTGGDQPRLAEVGWKNEISSIDVRAGNWDVFADEEYRGPTTRLVPGKYGILSEQWAKRIGSFKCATNLSR